MPNLLVLVTNVLPQDGTIKLAFISWTATGQEAGGELSIDFNSTLNQSHSAIEAAAKTAQQAQNGVVFVGGDKTQIFAGRSV